MGCLHAFYLTLLKKAYLCICIVIASTVQFPASASIYYQQSLLIRDIDETYVVFE